MFCSYIIPTIGRASLDPAARSVLGQILPQGDFELIIVNDSGHELPQRSWLQSDRVTVLNTNRSERSRARNSGASLAAGQYLAFLDDDDWILPGALESFWHLAEDNPSALWLYGGIKIVGEDGVVLAEINSGLNGYKFSQIMGGSWAPLQSSLIKSEAFFDVGGFNPSIIGTEDEDLVRQIAYLGDLANTPETVACLFRGKSWDTSTNYQRAPEDTKYSRDLVLSKPMAFRKLWSSADSKYWHGRTLRVLLSTLVWNLKKKRLAVACSRLFYSLIAAILSIGYVFSKEFWMGVRAEHAPDTLHFVMMSNEQRSNNQVNPDMAMFGHLDDL
jgi:glycosyltransferase involved in cell wall biosynthesis